MRKYVLTLVLISLCFLSYGAAYGSDFKKTRIAVLDFQIQGTGFETEDMGKIVAEWLITALVQEGRFDVIERRLLEKVLREQNLGASGVVDTQSASKLGKVLGARIVISGTVIKLSSLTEVNTRLIDVQTGSILAAEKVTSETSMRLATSKIFRSRGMLFSGREVRL
jgi:curli biogenesis system outer membrane secretion channel CsgG